MKEHGGRITGQQNMLSCIIQSQAGLLESMSLEYSQLLKEQACLAPNMLACFLPSVNKPSVGIYTIPGSTNTIMIHALKDLGASREGKHKESDKDTHVLW